MTGCPARCRRRGFTLTELAIVLGVIGLILGAVWSGAATVFQRQRVNDQVAQIKTLTDNIRALYSAAKTLPYGSGQDITAALVAMTPANSVVPAYMMVPGQSNPQNIENGNIIIYYQASGAFSSAPQIQINLYSVPKTCNTVLAYFSGLAADLGVTAVWSDSGANPNNWSNPANNALDSTSFGTCTFMAFQFNLHN